MSIYKIELLTDNHAVGSFESGTESKNIFLKKFALQNSKGGLGRTFVAVKPPDAFRVYGYYTISSSTVKFKSLPQNTFRDIRFRPFSYANLLSTNLLKSRAWALHYYLMH